MVSVHLGTAPPPEAILRAAHELHTNGWTVLEGVISPDECESYIDRIWDWLESLGTGIRRHSPSTCEPRNWPPTFGEATGIINCLEVAHQDFVWQLRKDLRITSVFEALWGTNALLSSFDSINVMRPLAVTHPKGADGGGGYSHTPWWHTDQRPSKHGMHCIQGFLSLSPVGHDAGTLEVKEGSHRAHEEYWDKVSTMSSAEKRALGDWYPFKPEEQEWWHMFPTKRLTGYAAGSLFLWDSRTVHQNSPPRDEKLWRYVIYTCYQPAAMATEADLVSKRTAYGEYRVTTHWPAADVCMPQEGKRHRDFTLRKSRNQVEDTVVLKLAGMQPYTAVETRHNSPLLNLHRD